MLRVVRAWWMTCMVSVPLAALAFLAMSCAAHQTGAVVVVTPTSDATTGAQDSTHVDDGPPDAAREHTPPVDETWSDAVARTGAMYLATTPKLRRADCSGLVNDILRSVGVDETVAVGGTKHHWERAVAEGRAARATSGDRMRKGDLVFFDRTYDANRNRVVDDELSHIALVIDVLPDETVVMVHRSSSRIEELRMNLRMPDVHMLGDVVLNSPVRVPRYGPADGPRLSGQLYRGHARPPRGTAPRVSPPTSRAPSERGRAPKV